MLILDKLKTLSGRARGEPVAEETESSSDSGSAAPPSRLDWLDALPSLLGTSLLAASIVLLFVHYTSFAMPKIVTFDIIKYGNAERAVASKFIGNDVQNTEDVTTLLLDVSKHTREAIRDAAGPGTVVVIAQSIIGGNTRDITDQVLTSLGLPTNVPTQDLTRRVIDIAPTMLGSGPRMLLEDPASSPKPKDSERPAGLP
jgi:hypothetical protein